MNEPLSFLPFAIAAGNGQVGATPTRTLVAAGLALLQRSAPLVRALSGRRAAILLPNGPRFFVALAACEGRGAVLIDPRTPAPEIALRVAEANAGAVLTTGDLSVLVDAVVPRVLLDGAPSRARYVAGAVATDVDLGSHYGLHLEAAIDVAASRDEAVLVPGRAGSLGTVLSHHDVLSGARALIAEHGLTSSDRVLSLVSFTTEAGLGVALAPLLAGGRLATMERFDARGAIDLARQLGSTVLACDPGMFEGMLQALRGTRWSVPTLRACLSVGSTPPATSARWLEATGLQLRPA